jgi:hypothetical protein
MPKELLFTSPGTWDTFMYGHKNHKNRNLKKSNFNPYYYLKKSNFFYDRIWTYLGSFMPKELLFAPKRAAFCPRLRLFKAIIYHK